MKKKSFFSLALLLGLLVSAINFAPEKNKAAEIGPEPEEFETTNTGRYLGKKDEEAVAVPDQVTLHYQPDDETVTYKSKHWYFWTRGAKAVELPAEDDKDNPGWMTITINPKELFGEEHDTLMFIIKPVSGWAGQSLDIEVPYNKYTPTEGKLEVWCVDGEGTDIEVYMTKAETQGGKIATAKFVTWKTIRVHCLVEKGMDIVPQSYKVYAFPGDYYGLGVILQQELYDNYLIKTGEIPGNALDFDISLDRVIPTSVTYHVKVTFSSGKTKGRNVGAELLYETPRFEQYYNYDGDDLGATYTKEKTTFKLWAPMCTRVELRIYNNGTPRIVEKTLGSDLHDEYLMSYQKGGVWVCDVPGDLDGKYYTYKVFNLLGENEVCDPYAKAAGVNGIRAMVLDFDKPENNPEGWDEVKYKPLEKPNDLSVYEIHVRDLTMDDTWKSNNGYMKGTYNAFAEKGTTYAPAAEEGKKVVTKPVTTGHDHIEEMGFNAIQLQPIFDADNGEITKHPENGKVDWPFNWGYNPLNYNVVEGGYSSNPFDGAVRVKEFKNLIKSYADDANNTRVIMDVVYNHVSSVSSSCFTKIMPKYYFRMTYTGAYTVGSGCGNDVKTEAPMMRKYIVDSVKWWASEYKIKGFRFDLMKLIDTITMRQVKDALYQIDNDIVCYGEGWAMGYSGPTEQNEDGSYKVRGTDTEAVYQDLYASTTSPGHLGGFSDSIRDALRGNNDMASRDKDDNFLHYNDSFYGYASSDSGTVGDKSFKVAHGILGNFDTRGQNPVQDVAYASCHDNWTLYDQLHFALGTHKLLNAEHKIYAHVEPEFESIADAMFAVESAVAFSNGIGFFLSGEELFRSKVLYEGDMAFEAGERSYEEVYGQQVSHNSYQSDDKTNALDYSRKLEVEYGNSDNNKRTIDTSAYYTKYCEMIRARGDREKVDYRSASTQDYATQVAYCNGEAKGSSLIQIKFSSATADYVLYYAGRSGGSMANPYGYTELFTSRIGEDKGYTYGDGTINVKGSTFVAFKKAK